MKSPMSYNYCTVQAFIDAVCSLANLLKEDDAEKLTSLGLKIQTKKTKFRDIAKSICPNQTLKTYLFSIGY